ncbi:MAG TPA: TIGR01777 family oxidoreductase [Steroidobacteraceae bacterium]|nr:TIGR01777 family oxidoreductase [Steroidobacteraceae bacterium]
MTLVFSLLTLQSLLGAIDTFWNHELVARLTRRRAARVELSLHAGRAFGYAFLLLALAWREWHGAWAALIAAVLVLEIAFTVVDFVIEDRTRHLPVFERVLHTVLTLLYGGFLMAFAPVLLEWLRQPTALLAVTHGDVSLWFSVLATSMAAWGVRDGLAALMHFRPAEWLREPIATAERPSGRSVLVTGATGFVGGHVVRALRRRGDSVWVWTRDADCALERFGPHVHVVKALTEIPAGARIDAIVALAGAPVIGPPWTRARRQLLIDSRVKTTQALLDWCATRTVPPRALLAASAIGFYGGFNSSGGDDWLSESSPAQEVHFQSRMCVEREAAANAAEGQGIRVVNLRIGLVLGRDGGILPQLMRPAKLGMAAVIGDGRQWTSWIHIADLVRVIETALDDPNLRGPVNAVAPAAVRQRDFQLALTQVLRRPLWLRVPAIVLRTALGEMSQLLVLGQRVAPRRLLNAGFDFRHYTLDSALRELVPDRVGAPPLRALDRGCEVWFNGDCPVCAREIGAYERAAQRRDLPMRFHDSMRTERPLSAYGLRREHLARRLYLRDEQGRVVSGFRAVLVLWSRIPEYCWLSRVFSWTPLRAACETLYDHVVAPSLAYWARTRHTGVRT